MSQVNAKWVLDEVDRTFPNSCTAAEKRHWLAQAEAFAAHAVGLSAPTEPMGDDTRLMVPVPYNNLYCRYVEAQMAYALGEMSRYNNAVAAWNELLLTWRDHCARGGETPQRVTALKLC